MNKLNSILPKHLEWEAIILIFKFLISGQTRQTISFGLASTKNNKNTILRKIDQYQVHLLTALAHQNMEHSTEQQLLKNRERKNKIKVDSVQTRNLHMIDNKRKKLLKLVLHLVHTIWELNGKVKVWKLKRTTG